MGTPLWPLSSLQLQPLVTYSYAPCSAETALTLANTMGEPAPNAGVVKALLGRCGLAALQDIFETLCADGSVRMDRMEQLVESAVANPVGLSPPPPLQVPFFLGSGLSPFFYPQIHL